MRLDLCEDCGVVGPNRFPSQMFGRQLCHRCFGDRIILIGIERVTADAEHRSASPDL